MSTPKNAPNRESVQVSRYHESARFLLEIAQDAQTALPWPGQTEPSLFPTYLVASLSALLHFKIEDEQSYEIRKNHPLFAPILARQEPRTESPLKLSIKLGQLVEMGLPSALAQVVLEVYRLARQHRIASLYDILIKNLPPIQPGALWLNRFALAGILLRCLDDERPGQQEPLLAMWSQTWERISGLPPARHVVIADGNRWETLFERIKNSSPFWEAMRSIDLAPLSAKLMDLLKFNSRLAYHKFGIARIRPSMTSGFAAPTLGRPNMIEQLVTLDNAAASVNRSKRTLEKYKARGMPAPRVEGGGGKPDEWAWSELRPWLETTFGRKLPERYPSLRRQS